MIDTNIREKNVYINIVKGFAIFLVVLGHCIQYGSGKDYLTSLSFFDNMGFKLIYSFHMPLFMLISGGLFYHTVTRHSQREIIVSRFTKLILPLIIWNLTEIILKFIVKRNGLALSIGTFLYSFWFLWAIFWLSFIVFVVRQFFSDSLLVYIALGVVALFIPEYYNAPNYVYMYPYFIVGYFWNKRNGFEKINHLLMNLKHQVLLTVLAVLAWGGRFPFSLKVLMCM